MFSVSVQLRQSTKPVCVSVLLLPTILIILESNQWDSLPNRELLITAKQLDNCAVTMDWQPPFPQRVFSAAKLATIENEFCLFPFLRPNTHQA